MSGPARACAVRRYNRCWHEVLPAKVLHAERVMHPPHCCSGTSFHLPNPSIPAGLQSPPHRSVRDNSSQICYKAGTARARPEPPRPKALPTLHMQWCMIITSCGTQPPNTTTSLRSCHSYSTCCSSADSAAWQSHSTAGTHTVRLAACN